MQTENETRLEGRNNELKSRLKKHSELVSYQMDRIADMRSQLVCLYAAVGIISLCLVCVCFNTVNISNSHKQAGMECRL